MLELRALSTHFVLRQGILQTVEDISFTVKRVKMLSIAGASDSGKSGAARSILQIVSAPGKSTLGRMILRTVERSSDQVLYHDRESSPVDVTALNQDGLRDVYGDLRTIFQDPNSCLNPRTTGQRIIAEPLRSSGRVYARAKELLDLVGLPALVTERNTHAFSVGQRQHIGITLWGTKRQLAGLPPAKRCWRAVWNARRRAS